jgi:hypothetical protein
MKIEINLERLADELAALVAKRLEGQIGSPESSPWMGMAEAIAYTGIPDGKSVSGWPRGGSPPTEVGAGCSTARSSMPLSATSLRSTPPRRSPGGPMSRESSGRKLVERGLYEKDATYYACASPPGSCSAVWKSLGPVGKMEARRLGDELIAAVRHGRVAADPADRRRRTFSEVADEWLAAQQALVDFGELAPRTYDSYELSVRRHLKPRLASRAIRSLTPNDLVGWHAAQRRSGAAAWSIKARWVALHSVLAYAVQPRDRLRRGRSWHVPRSPEHVQGPRTDHGRRQPRFSAELRSDFGLGPAAR